MVSPPSSFAPTLTWHDPTDVQVRKVMMTRLRSHPALVQHHPILQTREASATTPSLFQRLEWMLYHCAGSLSEYLHQPSLERRVQGLVTHYKRKRADSEFQNASRTCKRTRFPPSPVDDTSCRLDATSAVLATNVDLLQQVCQYLDGMDLFHCRGVNKFLYDQTPSFVTSLHLTTKSIVPFKPLTTEQGNGLSAFLLECTNLTSLRISNEANQLHIRAGVVFPRALTASKADASVSTASYGHHVICAVAAALEAGACLFLERVELVAPFYFATESDAVMRLLRALANGNTARRKPLQHLMLDATFLGDNGMQQVADLFETQYSCFERLQTLTVRNNFLGEIGCRALLEAIESFSELQLLDLSRNILSNTDAFALADLLDESVTELNLLDLEESEEGLSFENEPFCLLGLASLRTLKLQENFITCDGLHAITMALSSRKELVTLVGDVPENADHDDEEQDADTLPTR